MLDAFIIEEIKRRERLKQDQERPAIHIPLPDDTQRPPRRSETENDESPNRGVVVIDI